MSKKVFMSIFIVGTVIATISYLVLNFSYSSGKRSGKLVKLSQKGFIYKTFEGTLDLGSGDKLTWDFSIHDEDVGEELSQHSGKMVTLKYRELLWKIFYETKYDIVSWDVNADGGDQSPLFCRFVHLLRKSRQLVDQIRPLINEYDPDLMESVRKCQNNR